MSPTRLPVYRPAPPGAYIYPEPPRALPVAAIALLDASADGGPSLAFAACLSRELARCGRSAGVATVSFDPAAQLEPGLRAAFPCGQSLCALPAQAPDSALADQLAAERLWILLGPGALAFAASLVIMVGADVPVLRWPDALRERRKRISLALGGDGLAVAHALAGLLGES
jgi:hypothetical protein